MPRFTLPDLIPTTQVAPTLSVLREYDVSVVSSHYWTENESWRVAWRRLSDTMFLIPVKGSIQVSLHRGKKQVNCGQLLVIPEGVWHGLQLAPNCQALEQIAIHCHISTAWRTPLLARLKSYIHPLPGFEYRIAQFRRLTSAMNSPALGQEYGALIIRSLLAEWMIDGVDLAPDEGDIDPRVATVLSRIHSHYASDLTITDLAKEIAISTVQLRKLFHHHLHQSPKRYLQQYRIKEAARLLRTTQLAIKEIAFATGFNSEAYFHRCFSASYETTPRDYRLGRRRSV